MLDKSETFQQCFENISAYREKYFKCKAVSK